MQTSRLSRHIPNPTKETLSPAKPVLIPFLPSLAPTIPLAVSADLPVLDVSHQWSPTPSPFCLPLPLSSVCEASPRCGLSELHSFSWLRHSPLCVDPMLFIHLSNYPLIHPYTYPSTQPASHQPSHPSTYPLTTLPSIHLSIHPLPSSVHPPTCLPIHPFTHSPPFHHTLPPIHPFTHSPTLPPTHLLTHLHLPTHPPFS